MALRDVDSTAAPVVPSGLGELDRVLGGGFVAGSTTLLYGEPGVGKSTLALVALREMVRHGARGLLVSSEESATQVAQRARRLGEIPDGLDVATTTSLDEVEALVRQGGRVMCVVDSVSAVRDEALSAVAGSPPQLRQVAERLCAAARSANSALLLIGHVTKDGELAGPRALEHVVDTVLRFDGDRHATLRVLRAQKHRFGSTGEVGLFELSADALTDFRDADLGSRARPEVPGVVWTVTKDGSRSFLVEIQALVVGSGGTPRRVAHQLSAQRLALMLAVLESRVGLEVGGVDVFAASAGGLSAHEPAADLALAVAVASAARGFVVAPSLVAIGEVGLAGELRAVSDLARRVHEAGRRGATTLLVPREGELSSSPGVKVLRCASLADAVAAAQGGTT